MMITLLLFMMGSALFCPWYGMGWGGWFNAFPPLMWLLWMLFTVLFIVLIVLIVVWILRRISGTSSGGCSMHH
ncbi:hypothetical protein [Caldivirga sp.]|uniref:hypothetical protein n=1 Tax=Caldivirga sp. TaxID=2080243 RepID=UPI003D0D7B91